MGIFHLFFGFSGRINRGKYWLTLVTWLLIWIVAIVALLLGGLAIFDRNLQDGSLPDPEDFDAFWRMVRDYGVLSLIILLFLIVSWVSALAIGVKRLHDRDRSGWWIVLLYFGPMVLQAAQQSAESGTLASILLGLGAFAFLFGRWSSSDSCAGPAVPIGLAPIRCSAKLRSRREGPPGAAATSLSDFLLEFDSAFPLRLGHTWLPCRRRLQACSTRAYRRRGT
jgi:uncharacterized membrane protein YhaH (DUF805 family)